MIMLILPRVVVSHDGSEEKLGALRFSPIQRRNHVSKVGVRFLGLGYYYNSTAKIRQVYPIWCSRLHNHTLFIKKLCKKWGAVRLNFGDVRTSANPPVVVCPCYWI